MKIFVSDLPKRAANKNFIVSLFSDCGKIDPKGITIYQNKYKQDDSSHNFSAFVTFRTKEEAMKAKTKYNYYKIDDVPIQIIFSDDETRQIRQSGRGFVSFSIIDPSMDEKQLEDMLSVYGEIIYLKINRKFQNAYVQFRTTENIMKIKRDFEGKTINGREIYIRSYKNNDHNSFEFITTCYISNIPTSINTDDDLKCLFTPYGKVISSKVVKNKYFKRNVGIGFVTMETEEQANLAISKINGIILDGNYIYCGHYMSQRERISYQNKKYDERKQKRNEKEKKEMRKVFISNLDKNITKNDIKYIVSDIGVIDKIVFRECYGSVEFIKKEDAKRFIELSSFIFINGRQLRASYFQSGYDYYSDRSEENLNTFLTLLSNNNQNTEKITKCARFLSDIQIKYLLDNPQFINRWIEMCNLN